MNKTEFMFNEIRSELLKMSSNDWAELKIRAQKLKMAFELDYITITTDAQLNFDFSYGNYFKFS